MSVATNVPNTAMQSPSVVAQLSNWTTPRLLQTAIVLTAIVSALFLAMSLLYLHTKKAHLKSVGQDSVPSVIAAQKLKVALSDLDANVVNELLLPVGQGTPSANAYVKRRMEITESLVSAAQNITYGAAERKPIVDLTNSLSAYERLAIKARTLYQRHDEKGAISTYRDAQKQLQGSLLPAATALSDANVHALHDEDTRFRNLELVYLFFVFVIGATLTVLLVGTQLLLLQKTNRLFNVPLVGATFLFALLCWWLVTAQGITNHQLKVANDDCFTSLHALWQARAVAQDANSDESRYLFDKEHRAELEQSYRRKMGELLGMDASNAEVLGTNTAGKFPDGVTGFLADEMRNVTFLGESTAARAAIRYFGVYYAIDDKIKTLERSGNHNAAVKLDVGNAAGESNYAYDQFDGALGETIDINQKEFDKALAAANGSLTGMDWGLSIVCVAIVGLTVWGLIPRLREYDV